MSEERLIIYTDGSCLGNPGPGGHAAILYRCKKGKKGSVMEFLSTEKGGAVDTTNNQMELLGVIHGLKAVEEGYKNTVEIRTDSTYVKEGITDWIKKWKKNGWMNSKKKPVANKELWTKLDSLSSKFKMEWVWVKAHDNDPHNNLVDQIAKDEATNFKIKALKKRKIQDEEKEEPVKKAKA